MRIRKPSRIIDRRVGYVVDRNTVLGEWNGTRWENVPYKARLYANSFTDVRPRYEDGQLTARRWQRSTRNSYGRITGWEWEHPDGHTHIIYNLDGTLPKALEPLPRFEAIHALAEYARFHDANIGSPTSTVQSILGTTLPRDIIIRDRGLPHDDIWRGSRIQRRDDVKREFKDATLWDITNAFPSKLMDAYVPRNWKEYEAPPHTPIPEEPSGFAEAVVFIPEHLWYGPLPATRNPYVQNMTFPVDEVINGIWSFEELRMAERAGCDVTVLRFWTNSYQRQPFKAFGDLLADMRENLSSDAFRIAKKGAVGVVGSLARSGKQLRSRIVKGSEKFWQHGGEALPQALGLHGLVTASVRSQLYEEAIHPWPKKFISCHTDGVILKGAHWLGITSNMGDKPGAWRVKRHMTSVMLLDAQRYAYRIDGDRSLYYSVSGVPEEHVERWWDRRLHGYSFRKVVR